MSVTVLYSENNYADDSVERRIYGPDVRVIFPRASASLADLSDADCAAADGLMILRFKVGAADLRRFPKLRAICRMGVGYDNLDRAAAAERQIMIINVPDYGTTEVADHAIALTLALRRGLLLHHALQRNDPPAAWRYVSDPLVRRTSVQTFGIVGLGRIGTAAALRAKALGFRVVFFDPNLPNGAELGVGVERTASLEALLRQTDTLSIHAPAYRCEAAGAAAAGCGGGEHRARADRGPRCAGGGVAERASGGCRNRRAAGGTPGRTGSGTGACLSRARGVVRGAPDHHPAFRVLLAAGVG